MRTAIGKHLQELGVHAPLRHVLCALLLLDAVGVSLVRVVVRAGVLLLLDREGYD